MATRIAIAKTVTVSATSSNTSTAISGVADDPNAVVVVKNEGPNTVFVRFGVGAQTATTADIPVLAFEKEEIVVGSGVTHMGSICLAAETAKIHAAPGRTI